MWDKNRAFLETLQDRKEGSDLPHWAQQGRRSPCRRRPFAENIAKKSALRAARSPLYTAAAEMLAVPAHLKARKSQSRHPFLRSTSNCGICSEWTGGDGSGVNQRPPRGPWGWAGARVAHAHLSRHSARPFFERPNWLPQPSPNDQNQLSAAPRWLRHRVFPHGAGLAGPLYRWLASS